MLRYEYFSKEQKRNMDWMVDLKTITNVRFGLPLQRTKYAHVVFFSRDSRLCLMACRFPL